MQRWVFDLDSPEFFLHTALRQRTTTANAFKQATATRRLTTNSTTMPVLTIGDNLPSKTRDIIIILLAIFLASVLAAVLAYGGATMYNLYREHKRMKAIVKHKIFDVEARAFETAYGKTATFPALSPNFSLAPISYSPARVFLRNKLTVSQVAPAPPPVVIKAAPVDNTVNATVSVDASPVIPGAVIVTITPIENDVAANGPVKALPAANKGKGKAQTPPAVRSVRPTRPSDKRVSISGIPRQDSKSRSHWSPPANRESAKQETSSIVTQSGAAKFDGIAEGSVAAPSGRSRLATVAEGRNATKAPAAIGRRATVTSPQSSASARPGHVKVSSGGSKSGSKAVWR
ncbi:hypothetical protein AX17_002429 [Amanita inopinata Kibby_2008]|nr:hypothetical protein AX17_002429 [Amanita inopinata Kibby_2008]